MFWDRVAGVYDLFVNGINRKTHQALRRIVAELIGPEDRVLECACGTGLLTQVIAEKCKALTATDFAPKMLKRAEKNCAAYGNITFRQADITALDEPDGAFDKAVAGNVIHLLDEPLKALDGEIRDPALFGINRADRHDEKRHRKRESVRKYLFHTSGLLSLSASALAGIPRAVRRFLQNAFRPDLHISAARRVEKQNPRDQ